MRRLALLLIVLWLACGVLAAPKVVRSYAWNGKQYSVLLQDDGTRITIKGEAGMTEAAAIDKCTAIKQAESTPEPVVLAEKTLADYSDDEIIKEVQRRKLTVKDLGLEDPK